MGGPSLESARAGADSVSLKSLNHLLEWESERIANVLHDEAGQFLTSAHIALAELARELPSPFRERLQQVRRELDHVEERLRLVSHELHPRMLRERGLAGAVRFLADSFSRRSHIPLTVDVSASGTYPASVETVMYRLVQEGLTNIGRYSHATRAAIVLCQRGPVIHCSVRDNGIGFDAVATLSQSPAVGHGLHGMQDRLRAVGGMLEISSAPKVGTELHAIVPLETWNACTTAVGG
jgi:signal transduction histidine kinase